MGFGIGGGRAQGREFEGGANSGGVVSVCIGCCSWFTIDYLLQARCTLDKWRARLVPALEHRFW